MSDNRKVGTISTPNGKVTLAFPDDQSISYNPNSNTVEVTHFNSKDPKSSTRYLAVQKDENGTIRSIVAKLYEDGSLAPTTGQLFVGGGAGNMVIAKDGYTKSPLSEAELQKVYALAERATASCFADKKLETCVVDRTALSDLSSLVKERAGDTKTNQR